jgi:hypothetical protein
MAARKISAVQNQLWPPNEKTDLTGSEKGVVQMSSLVTYYMN